MVLTNIEYDYRIVFMSSITLELNMSIETEDMGESPFNDTRFQPGVSGNPAGRPKGSGKGRPRSKMRTQLSKTCELQEDALEIMRITMTGKNSQGIAVASPAKEKVDAAKFVLNKIESLNNSCLREEMAILGVRDKGNAEGAKQLEENQQDAASTGVFSLDLESDEIVKH